MKRSKRRLALLLALILIFFLGLVLYMVFFQLNQAPDLRADSRNMRNQVDEKQFGRGRFYDRNQEVLVEREKNEDGSYHRYLVYPNMYSHLIGYNSPIYGKSGLEASLNAQLLNLSSDNAIAALRGSVLNEGTGNDVRLTIDNALQYDAYTAMEDHLGAAIILDPRTGAVLAMVSLPSFDANTIDDHWNELIEDSSDRLFPRATQGLYTPGSVMKAITSLALLENGSPLSYEDTGHTTIDGASYENYDGVAYGSIGLQEALVHSSNVYFIDKSKDVSPQVLRQAAEELGFNEELPFDLPTSQSRADYAEGMDLNLKVSDSFGQGDILASPLQMTMAFSAIANGGNYLRPYVIQDILDPSGHVRTSSTPQVLRTLDAQRMSTIRDGLIATAASDGLSDQVGVAAGGKTGTAQTTDGLTNAWTIGFAPADHPRVIVCVVLEQDGRTAAESALPICADLLRSALDRQAE